MLSVIIDARASEQDLPALLAALTPAAVDGLVRDLVIVADPSPLVSALCEETGAEIAGGLAEGATRARYDRLLVLPAAMRLKTGWIAALSDHLYRGGAAALLAGAGGGLFRPAPVGLLAFRNQVLAHADLQGLRRGLGRGAVRIG